VIIDQKLVQRAVTNLLQNAVNYTPSGGMISLGIESTRGDDEDFIVISVADTGPGIPKEEQDKVFDKYYRSSRTIDTKGTGLGLFIVKTVAKAHGGQVELTSEEGKGSTFKIILPSAPKLMQ
jgi:signal transduction histidine kinase